MPAVNRKQQGFAAMSSTPEGRKKLQAHGKKPMPVRVAHEFMRLKDALKKKT